MASAWDKRPENQGRIRAAKRRRYLLQQDRRKAEAKERYHRRMRENPDRERAVNRLRRYGITQEQFEARLAAQGNVCAICHKAPKHKWCVDHNHTTGAVRGVLCMLCNLALGHYETRRAGIDAYLLAFGT